MKKLLMATDLSARSDRALECAMNVAREHGGELTIVHVIDDDLPASLADAQKMVAEEAIRGHVDRLASGDGLPVSVEVVFGKAHVEILEMSEQIEAEQIVIGMHREDAFRDMFRGTTAERVIRGASIPVLLVKNQVSGPYRRIMVGVDFSIYSRRAVEFAVKFVSDGEFHLVHAYDVPFKGFLYGQQTQKEVSKRHQADFEKMVEDEMASFLASVEGKAPRLERVMQMGTVQEVLHQQIDRLKPDLLVIGTHGRTGVAHAILGSVAEDLLRDPPCDVLAVKAW